MGERKVSVWGKQYVVTTERLSKSVWQASGTYQDESHTTKDQTEGAAIKRWCEWATYKGNG